MILLFWDASALIKRYFPEEGSDIADALFAIAQPHEMLTCPWGYAETYSLLVRRWNERVLNDAAFNTAVTALRNEVVDGLRFDFLPITDITIFESISITKKRNYSGIFSPIRHSIWTS